MPSHSFSLPSTSLDYRREPILPANVANVVQLRLPHSTLCCIKRCALCFVYSTFRYKTMCYLKPPFCERTLPARLTPHPVPRSLLFFGGGGGNHRFFTSPPLQFIIFIGSCAYGKSNNNLQYVLNFTLIEQGRAQCTEKYQKSSVQV